MYSLGQCVNAIFNRLRVSVPPQMDKYLTRMLSEEYLRRPSAKQLINSPLFNSDYIKLMSSMVDIAMKPPAETLVILESVQNTHAQIPAFLCVQKVLPTIRAVLQICIRDFQLRDSREICRNTIHVSLNLLSTLVEEKKINEEEFAKTGLTQVLQLWSMADRSVRTSLLRSLKSLLVVIESNYVNKHIFDPMLAGFADSNAVMREDTLKNLVHVVDKLDGKLMQDKLVRSIVNMQNDSEASLRTNATIFLGKIALKLEESARNRIVYPAFIKAMKDQFLHCRIAGIKSTVVCLHSIDLGFLLNKMLPQICLLSVDPSADVREIAIGVIRDSAELLKENHARMKIIEKANREKHAANSIKMKNENSPRPSGDNTPQPMPNNSVAATAASGASAWIQSLVVPELDKSPEIDDTEQKIGELRSKSNTNQNQGIKLSNNNVSPKTSGAVIQQNNDGWDDLDIESEDEIYVKPNSNYGLSNAMMQSKISARKNSSIIN
jgi:SCY1-like protein 1